MKAWQIFIIIFVIPYLLPLSLMYIIDHHYANVLIVALLAWLYIIWLWTLGINLNKKVSSDLRSKSGLFKCGLIYAFLYLPFFATFMISGFTRRSNPRLFDLITPLHFFAMVCMIYGLIFVAKALVTAEKQEKAKADDYMGIFFMLWLLPIGIWWVQPRVNKLFKSYLHFSDV
jgi:hypothetical protein